MHVTFRQLQVFEAVARLNSYTRAAEHLHLSQPGVSMQIKQLEESIGLPLFEHVGKKIHLTEAGKEMYGYSQRIGQLLKEADTHFQAQQYLKPVNQNAFVLYRAVLTLEPDHALALERISQIKDFYRENGEKYFSEKKWAKALSFFERYYLIDTDNKQVNDKVKICREKVSHARFLVKNSKSSLKKKSRRKSKAERQREEAEKKEEIKRLLEESGTESSWIMKYLFEDESDRTNSDKPW